MGTASYVLVGAEGAMAQTFACAVTARRVLSRAEAKRQVRGEQLRASWRDGTVSASKAKQFGRPTEEAPQAYKDVDRWSR